MNAQANVQAKLSQHDIERLGELPGRWIRPMDLCGPIGARPSAFLARMHRLGLAEQQNWGSGSQRPAYRYRISQAGRDLLDAERSDC